MVPEDDDEGTAKTDAVVVIILLLPRSPATPEGSVEGGRLADNVVVIDINNNIVVDIQGRRRGRIGMGSRRRVGGRQ